MHFSGNVEPASKINLTRGVENHEIPDEGVVAVEESLLADGGPVLGETGHNAQRDGQETQLNVPHPNGDVRALQDLLEVDA